MKQLFKSMVVIAGLAIFTMLFGAGNLMYPIKAGLASGDKFGWGMFGFFLTAILTPVLGLIGIILFNGNYRDFFYRLGKIPGALMIGYCMAVIGPCYAMSRIVNLSQAMLSPFLPDAIGSATIFNALFCFATFLATYQESQLMAILAKYITPILLLSLGIILGLGLIHPHAFIPTSASALDVFIEQAVLGYQLLDLIGTIFFGSIVLTLLKNNMQDHNNYDHKALALIGMKSAILASSLLGIIYLGMALVGAFYGQGLGAVNEAELFSIVSFRVLGSHGAFIVATAVLMACFSTLMALAAVLAEYLQHEITHNKLRYVPALAFILIATTLISWSSLSTIKLYASPIINTGYPAIMALTLANIAYKLFNFSPVKTPVALVLAASIYLNWTSYSVYAGLFGF